MENNTVNLADFCREQNVPEAMLKHFINTVVNLYDSAHYVGDVAYISRKDALSLHQGMVEGRKIVENALRKSLIDNNYGFSQEELDELDGL